MFNVIIIGAGPAGSVAAIILARRGWRVRLIEQRRFPRDKVCGECLSALGIEVLKRLGLAHLFRPIRLHRTLIVTSAAQASVELPAEMWGISRIVLDQQLLSAAVSAGAEVMQPVRCESVEAESTLRLRDLETNRTWSETADYVIVADGKQRGRSCDLGVKAHYRNMDAPGDSIVLFGVNGHYGGIAPIENDVWNVALSVPSRRVRDCDGDFDRMMRQLGVENAHLSRIMKHASRVTPWLTSPLPRHSVARHWPKRIIPIGNAAAALEPVGGEGMGLAMCSAEIAAEALDNAVKMNRSFPANRVRREFQRLWRVRSAACRAMAWAISKPTFGEGVVEMISCSDGATRAGLSLMGK